MKWSTDQLHRTEHPSCLLRTRRLVCSSGKVRRCSYHIDHWVSLVSYQCFQRWKRNFCEFPKRRNCTLDRILPELQDESKTKGRTQNRTEVARMSYITTVMSIRTGSDNRYTIQPFSVEHNGVHKKCLLALRNQDPTERPDTSNEYLTALSELGKTSSPSTISQRLDRNFLLIPQM
jgi:hypothetical protein